MDSAWNQGGKDSSPLKPGEVDNDFEEQGYQKARVCWLVSFGWFRFWLVSWMAPPKVGLMV